MATGELLDQMERALARLRAAPPGVAWRDAVLESSCVLARGVAGLIESLRAEPPRDMTEAHLRAQRFARVKVAEMQLYLAVDVKAGRARRDLYGALKSQIDEARAAYLNQFLQTQAGMPDYFHQELVCVLAQNDEKLLGVSYPGPLAPLIAQ